MVQEFIALFQNELYVAFWKALWSYADIWVPILLGLLFFDTWMRYKQRAFINETGSVLLEIKIPREMYKSPAAMESFLTSIHEPVGGGNLIDVFWTGKVRPWFSLEVVSLGGEVHFYIWMAKPYKSIVESQLYAQFPGVEVHEAEDYALRVHHNPDKYTFGWFGQLGLVNHEAYPIKTYIDYGLDKDPDEEYKIDPFVSLLEFMGSLKKGEQAWVQILIQAHTKEGLKHARFIPKPDWKDEINAEIKKFIKENAPIKEEDTKEATVRDLTDDQKDVVRSMERNQSKWAYDTMIRITYFSEKDVHNPANIGGLIRGFKQFSSAGLNGLKPVKSAKPSNPWQDFRSAIRYKNEKKLLEAYKRRAFFNPPFKNFWGKPFVLTTEELATLYHFPSVEVASTPTLTRVPSKKSEPPSNLPV